MTGSLEYLRLRAAVASAFGWPGGAHWITFVLRTAVPSAFGRPGGAHWITFVLRTAVLSAFGRPGGAHARATRVISTSVTVLAMAAACIRPTTSLLYWGKARRNALGSNTRAYSFSPLNP